MRVSLFAFILRTYGGGICGKFCGLRGRGVEHFVKGITKCSISGVFRVFEAQDSKGVT